MVGEGAKGRAGGGGDAGLHVRDLAGAGRDQVGRGDMPEGGQGVLQVLAEHPEEVHGKEVGWVQGDGEEIRQSACRLDLRLEWLFLKYMFDTSFVSGSSLVPVSL